MLHEGRGSRVGLGAAQGREKRQGLCQQPQSWERRERGKSSQGRGRELLLVAPIMPTALTQPPLLTLPGTPSLSHTHASPPHPAVSKAAYSSKTFSPSMTHTHIHKPLSSMVWPLARPITHTHPR